MSKNTAHLQDSTNAPSFQDQIIDLCRSWLARDPEDADAWRFLAESLLRSGSASEAERAARQAVARLPTMAGPYKVLGDCLLAQRRAAEAATAYVEAIARPPVPAGAYFNLAQIRFAEGAAQEGEKLCRRALELRPDEPAGYLFMANQFVRMERHEEAVALLQLALTSNPDCISAYDVLAKAQSKTGKFLEAMDHSSKANELRVSARHFVDMTSWRGLPGQIGDALKLYGHQLAHGGDPIRASLNLARAADLCARQLLGLVEACKVKIGPRAP
ncbi:tetratricopeptide repeat protein [Azospirillum cavernae]|nr:tetratricopeptide repeat protein [Azospirillum cavernae]